MQTKRCHPAVSVFVFTQASSRSYLHELLLLLFSGADGVSNGADLVEDGLRVLQLVAGWAVGYFLVNPGGQKEEEH